jgi:hypothetical protein
VIAAAGEMVRAAVSSNEFSSRRPRQQSRATEQAARPLAIMMGIGGGLYLVRSWTEMWKTLDEKNSELPGKSSSRGLSAIQLRHN